MLFNNGESRLVDIAKLFADSPGGLGPLEEKIVASDEVFASAAVLDYTVGWPGVGLASTDSEGQSVIYPYDIDPLVLYQAGVLDEEVSIDLGKKIRTIRKANGLTQEELARRSGTTKHYISRLENNKSDVEFLTLKKIVEAGLNKKLTVDIS